MSGPAHAQILIVGAGVAGLAAAAELTAAGRDVLVVEARDRVGGRIHTVQVSGLKAPVELGAEFVHGRPPEIQDIVEKAGLELRELAGERYFRDAGGLGPGGPAVDFDGLLAAIEQVAEPDRSFQQFLDQAGLDDRAKAWAAAYVEGFNAARRERISVRSLVEDERAAGRIDGDRAFRIAGGYQRVPQFLLESARGARLRLDTPIAAIRWHPGHVTAETQSGSVEARAVLVTVPLGVLQARPGQPGAIAFRPEPPNLQAARALEMGQAVRITLQFREPFWERREGLEQVSFLHSLDPRMPTWWTALPARVPILTGWAGGPAAVQYGGKTGHFVLQQAMAALAGLLDVPESEIQAQLVGWHWHDWQSDPFARGAYSYVPAGAMDARRALAEPVSRTLYFAGEACELEGHSAMVHGAIASGRRAAARMLRDL